MNMENMKKSNENIRQRTVRNESVEENIENRENLTGIFGTYLNMFKATLGTGMLSMPMAFKNTGVYIGPPLLLFVGMLIMWCGYVLIKNIRKIGARERNPKITYPDAMRIAMEKGPSWSKVLAPSAPAIINTFNILCQYLTMASYILFMANVSKHMCDHYWMSFHIRVHILIVVVPLLILNCFLRDLRLLGYFSMLGNIAQFAGIIISYYYLYGGFKDFDKLVKVAVWDEIAQGFGIAVYSYTSAGVLLSLAYNMKKPEWFIKPCGVLNTGTIFTVTLYISIGLIGYAKFQENIAGTFIRNFPNEPLASVAVMSFGAGVFLGFFIHIYPIVEIVLTWYQKRYTERSNLPVSPIRLLYVDVLTRSITVLAGASFVLVFTEINLLVSLIGSACMCSINIIFPCILEYIMAATKEPSSKRRQIIAATVGIISTVFCLLGVGICILQMCNKAFGNQE